MPLQVYMCPHHGEWDLYLSFRDKVLELAHCPDCGTLSEHILYPPGAIIVQGGTGAGRGNAAARKQLAWDTKANEQQHDPYTQAKTQAEHVYHECKDLGYDDPPKPTEESIQVAAAQIAKEKPPTGTLPRSFTAGRGKRRASNP